jgi:hypothetical protein
MAWRAIAVRAFFAIACVPTGFAGTKEVYVWQRKFSAEVAASLAAFQPDIDGCCVLAAEVTWINGRMYVTRPAIAYGPLLKLGKPIGLALRIGAFSGSFDKADATARKLGELAATLIADAASAGLAITELQVDFDAAESKLAGYGAWLSALREVIELSRTRLVFTALPAWLKQAEFARLARAADGFVLQVHSLEKPTQPDAPFTLCEPERALAWARQAGAVGVPFRVALPTYGYVVAFTSEGKFLALAAEGPSPAWPRGTQLRVVRAEAVAMSSLARTLAATPPAHCTGVIWFRLPIATDGLNWDAVTLSTILRGGVPARRLIADVAWPERGLAEIMIVNRGETTELLPARIDVRWPADARILASDGLGGFFLETRGGEAQGIIRAADVAAEASIAPGRKRTIAWLRFAHEIPLEVSLPAAP